MTRKKKASQIVYGTGDIFGANVLTEMRPFSLVPITDQPFTQFAFECENLDRCAGYNYAEN